MPLDQGDNWYKQRLLLASALLVEAWALLLLLAARDTWTEIDGHNDRRTNGRGTRCGQGWTDGLRTTTDGLLTTTAGGQRTTTTDGPRTDGNRNKTWRPRRASVGRRMRGEAWFWSHHGALCRTALRPMSRPLERTRSRQWAIHVSEVQDVGDAKHRRRRRTDCGRRRRWTARELLPCFPPLLPSLVSLLVSIPCFHP